MVGSYTGGNRTPPDTGFDSVFNSNVSAHMPISLAGSISTSAHTSLNTAAPAPPAKSPVPSLPLHALAAAAARTAEESNPVRSLTLSRSLAGQVHTKR